MKTIGIIFVFLSFCVSWSSRMWGDSWQACASRFLYNTRFLFSLSSLLFVALVISVSLFDQFCTSSPSVCWQPLNTWHSHQCHVHKSLIRFAHYFPCFYWKTASSRHENARTEAHAAFHTRIGPDVHALSKAHSYFSIGICVLRSEARVQLTPLWQTNKQKVSQSILSTGVLRWEWPVSVLLWTTWICIMKTYIMRRKVDNFICHANWVYALSRWPNIYLKSHGH